MFGSEMMIALNLAQAAISAHEEMYFNQLLANSPLEIRAAMQKERAEKKEKERQEAAINRRHTELCEAIRDSGRSGRYIPSSIYPMASSQVAAGLLAAFAFEDVVDGF